MTDDAIPSPDVPITSSEAGLAAADVHEGDTRELLREVLTMALYVSLSLLAVLIALPVGNQDDRVAAGLTVLGTAIGLVLAHHVAFRLSTRLVNGGLLTPESIDALKAQALGGLPVAVAAALPVLVLGEEPGEVVSELLLLAFVALVGYRSARFTSGPARSFLYVCGLVLVVAAVMLVKLLAGH
jgi:hypothetical protein